MSRENRESILMSQVSHWSESIATIKDMQYCNPGKQMEIPIYMAEFDTFLVLKMFLPLTCQGISNFPEKLLFSSLR